VSGEVLFQIELFHEAAMRVGTQASDEGWVFQKEVPGIGEKMLEQPGLACPSRPRQHDRGEAPGGPPHLLFQLSTDVAHE